MRLCQLAIHQLPGVAPLTLNELAPGINFVTGPNAIGKSSIARALQAVLQDPQRLNAAPISVTATFEHDGQRWQVERSGGAINWQIDGRDVEPPPLPAAEALPCYWLSAESLLVPADADQAALHHRLRQVLAGGIDLGQVRQATFPQAEGYPKKDYGDLLEARQQRSHQEEDYRRLAAERDALPQRRQALEAARRAREDVRRVEAALALATAYDEEARTNAGLAAIPDGVKQLKGDEAQRLAALKEDLAAAEQTITEAQAQLTEQTRALERLGLGDHPPSQSVIQGWGHQLQTLREAEQEARRHQAEADRAAARENEALTDLAQTLPDLPRLTPAVVEDIEAALLQRSQQAAAGPATGSPLLTPGGLAGMGLGALAAGLLTLAGSWLDMATLMLVGGAAAMVAALLILVAARQVHRPGNPSAADDAARELLSRHGIRVEGLQGSGLGRLLRIARRLDDAREAVAEARAEHQHHAARADERRQALLSGLSDGVSAAAANLDPPDSDRLKAHIDDLAQRSQQAREIDQRRQRAEGDLQQARERRASIQAERDGLFQAIGLTPEDHQALETRLEWHARHEQLQQTLREQQVLIRERAQPLAADDDLQALAANGDVPALEARRDELAEQARQVDDRQAAIADLQVRLDQAGGDNALATALAREQTLEEQIRDRIANHLQQRLGEWLLDDVERAYRRQHEPALIADARDRFERFTAHQWSLTVDDQQTLAARDLQQNRERSLEELSAGTRTQLLLAARIAWARDLERTHVTLPLVLDEALSATDPQRFEAVVNNLAQLVDEESRQILFLTARPEEPVLWQQITGASPRLIDLQALRQQQTTPPAMVSVPARPAPPRPDGLNATQYAERLQVPAVDPRRDAGDVHLFHLLRDDLSTLHELLDHWGITTLGPAENWLASPAGQSMAHQHSWPVLLAGRIAMARAWLQLAAEGLGQPLDADTIARSDTQTRVMTGRINTVAKQHDWEAAPLIAALRNGAVKNLGKPRIDALESWLTDHGYLDPRPPLDAEALEHGVLGQLGHHYTPTEIRTLCHWLALASGRAGQPRETVQEQ